MDRVIIRAMLSSDYDKIYALWKTIEGFSHLARKITGTQMTFGKG